MILHVHPETPQKRIVRQLIDGLEAGEIYIMPTDTVYAIVCHFDYPASMNQLYKISGKSEKQPLSLLCRDVAMASHYARNIPNHIFRFMKSHLPGPYTFILNADREMGRRGTGQRKTVGVRIIDHPLHRALMEELSMPLVATSITVKDEYATDPEDLERMYGKLINAVVDGGIRFHEFSTILDCSSGDFELIRKGKGDIKELGLTEPDL